MRRKGKSLSDAGWKFVEYIKDAGSRMERKMAGNRNGYLLFLPRNAFSFSIKIDLPIAVW